MAGDGNATSQEYAFVDRVLTIVRERAGIDFGNYRPGTIGRRIANRMLCAGIAAERDYLALLEGSPEETWQLIDRLTIKVSRFNRGRALFDFLRAQVAPAWQARGTPVRIWCAGCARGEEAYSFALLLDRCGLRGEVLATDIDPGALSWAECGAYRPDGFGELDAEEAALCFEPQADTTGLHRIRSAIRARARFVRHDLTAAPAPGRFDLVSCRNVLIYLSQPTQRTVMSALVSALAPEGRLCLGESEWPQAEFLDVLEPMPRQLRVFRRKA